MRITDLAASRKFYADILGLQVTAETEDRICLRAMEERGHHSLVLVKGTKPVTGAISFKTFDEEDLDRAAKHFLRIGQPVEWVTRPNQGRTLATTDVHGIPLEFYHRMERLPPIHQQYALYRGVRPLRIDHVNAFSPNVDESVAYYSRIGFRVTEYTEDEATGGAMGRMDASQRQRSRHCIHERPWSSDASRCVLGAHPDEHNRPAGRHGIDRLRHER